MKTLPRGSQKPAESFFDRRLFWPLNLDFLAPMRLQVRVNEDQDVYYFKGKTSETIESQWQEPIKTELGGRIGIKDSSGLKTVVEYGSRDPTHEFRRTQEEIFNDVLDNTGVDDVIAKRRGLVHQIPKPAEDFESLQGSNEIWQEQQAYSNKSKQWRKATGLPLRNWYNNMKNKLLTRGIVTDEEMNSVYCTRLRSSLNTEFLLPDKREIGYDTFYSNEELLPLEQMLVKDAFWEDTGLPQRLLVDHQNQAEGWIYKLDKEDYLIGF